MNLPDITKENPSFEKIDFVPSFDSKGHVDLKDLIHHFQNLATRHIDRLGMGEEFEKENSFFYVVLRYKGYFLKELETGRHYTMVTFPTYPGPLQLYRYCYLLDEEKKVCFYLISLWVLMDSKTRRLKTARVFRDRIEKEIPDLKDVKPLTEETLGNFPLEEDGFVKYDTYQVGKQDIDENGHMNNTVYFDILKDHLPEKSIHTFEMNYEKECLFEEKLNIFVKEGGFLTFKGMKNDGLSFKIKYTFMD